VSVLYCKGEEERAELYGRMTQEVEACSRPLCSKVDLLYVRCHKCSSVLLKYGVFVLFSS
jgi:hypothetical protein